MGLDFTEKLPEEQHAVGWNNDFSSWLPRYHKPEKPCEYCRSRSLECFVYNATGERLDGCSPCNALFRPCSFNSPEKTTGMQKSKTALDTLDSVAEDNERCFGGLTGKKQMRSLGYVGPIEDDPDLPAEKKKGAAAARFPRTAIKILKEWMIEHIDHPYPTDQDKEDLKLQTGLTLNQICNWMANTRRRQKARPKRSASPSVRPSTEAINIPVGRTWESLNPFERWKHSPPENEPAPMTAIARAVETFDAPETASLSSSYQKGNSNSSTGSFSIFKAPSISSLETGLTNISSGSLGSHNSAYSYGSRHSLGSLNSLSSKKERRRRRRVPTRTPKLDIDSEARLFQCTFCTDRFKSKYDWSRHEKSLHLSLEKWICAPLGEVIACLASGRQKCVYCDTLDPTKEHLATHNHGACEEKGLESRTFYRKDHLRQHLRLMHAGCKMTSSMESWKSEAQQINSRCGFCGMEFDKWQDRVDHLAKEFRNGATMKNWKGCRGLDQHIANYVTNAMPPYLIANESISPFPFSATNSACVRFQHHGLAHKDLEFLLPTDKTFLQPQLATEGFSSVSPTEACVSTPHSSSTPSKLGFNATCWEILTLRLGRFARKQIEEHGTESVTDAMLQTASRLILYGEDDSWNQTAADNPEWLSLFKKAHGLDQSPWPAVTAHHDILEDLGLGSIATLDKSFNLDNFKNTPKTQPRCSNEFECLLTGTTNLTASGQPPFCPLSSSTSKTTPVKSIDYARLNGAIPEVACATPAGPCLNEQGQISFPRRAANNNIANNDTTKRDAYLYLPEETTACSMAQINSSTCCPLPQDHFDFSSTTWDQVPQGFDMATTTSAALGTSVPASTAANGVQGGLRWDDNELGFNLDLDLDMDVDMDLNIGVDLNLNLNLGMGMGMGSGSGMEQQQPF
ncbi:hypothetical protein BDV95DRAFT_503606 [Massariosphaeria phaeospora]|uniref:Homeobox and C2H2 transcription factor n=1 Tax=Massariosphaeria phaeospora TaxID=100035 RepID=A0A7C8I061_9PLEO|nr:hypothetical protein BDV95DRAFT_503606 [Massariosphaeria phaeospora]